MSVIIGQDAANYKIRRGVTALDGSNPTAVATGLSTIVSATVTRKDSSAPGVDPSAFSVDFSGTDGTLNIYAWKVTASGDATLVASTNTDDVCWIAIGS